jgi:hypothetical protein
MEGRLRNARLHASCVDQVCESRGWRNSDFVIVGRKHNVLPVDLITQEGDLVTVDSHEIGFSFEGRLRDGKLTGVIRQAATETPLVLVRAKS